MKYNVGYQDTTDNEYINYIVKNKEYIGEVYFAWGDFPNGRNTFIRDVGQTWWEVHSRLIYSLGILSESSIPLNLLLNGNCYGRDSQSRAFFNKIGDTLDYLKLNFNLTSVTTTSPLIAKFIKNNFADIDVRASVNMEIGTVQGMKYISEYFDSFYMKRELNRSLKHIKELKSWCDNSGKKLYMLANSGCLNNCSAHNFHDNLVAHEHEISQMDNSYNFRGVCYDYLTNRNNLYGYLKDTNFVRPEDIHLYDGYFEAAKLATRVNSNPMRVVRAYIEQKYTGSIMDILEPNHSGVIYPLIIENSKIYKGFSEHTMQCHKNCSECNYCDDILEKAIVNLGEEIYAGS